ncbi:MAG: ABC transporter ATP-binding protein [Verrucomicrobiota bacterium]|nr:ABC transporter ATP-binding protein [Verrucomicrobiota bacterium]
MAKLLSYVRPQWKRMAVGVLLGMASAMFNALMLISFQVIFSLVLKGDTPVRDVAQRVPFLGPVKITDIFPVSADQTDVGWPVVVVAAMIIPVLIFCRGFLSYLSSRTYTKAASHVLYKIRQDLYASILRQSLSFFNRSKAGELIQVVANQSGSLQVNALALVQAITKHPLSILSILIVLFGIDPFFTAMSLFVFPLCLIPVRMISKSVRRSGQIEVGAAADMLVCMHEAFGGIRLIKGNSREDYELKRFEKGNRISSLDALKFNKLADLSSSIVETVASLGVAAGLVYWWYMGRTAADFFILVLALTQMYPPIKELSRIGMTMQKTLAASENVFELLERESEVSDKPDAVSLPRVAGAIRLENVSFAYTRHDGAKLDKKALTDINCTFEPGKFYALVGPSGSGKSTLFSLLMRYYDVDSGSIIVDGHDIRDVTQRSLRENIGIVSQDVFLFHDTIWENIRYGRLDASREDILEAARKAHVDAFALEFQNGYESVVGDGGSSISGGQKQRISIARTILKNAPILLLDEATSALDTESERFIQESLHDLAEGRTVVAIAHRLSTVLAAHKIIVMQEGRIEAIGSNEELLRTCPLYARLHALQFQGGHERPPLMAA